MGNSSVKDRSQPAHQSAGEQSNTVTAYQTYLRVFTLGVGALVLLTVLFNFSVDPYARYEAFRLSGFNERKPAAVDQVALAKAYQVTRVQPTTVFLGNSRVDVGLDPRSPFIPQSLQPVYNFAIPGTGVQSALNMLRHANEHSHIKKVVFAADFMDFLTNDAPNAQLLYTNPRLDGNGAVNTFARVKSRAGDLVATLLSMSATLDSLRTVSSQANENAGGMTPLGLNLSTQFNQLVQKEGHYSLFQDKNNVYLQRLMNGPKSVFTQGTGSSPEWKALQELVDECAANDIELVVFIHPYHADVLNIFDVTSLWPEFDEWKIHLTKMLDRQNIPVTLWDFAILTRETMEPVPSPGDTKSNMRWYWEGGHYKRELGEKMLQQMFTPNKNGFGQQLNPQMIDDYLDDARTQLTNYQNQHPQALERMEKLIGSR